MFQAIYDISQLQKSDFAVLVPGFEKLGLALDNCGRTTNTAYCRIFNLRDREAPMNEPFHMKIAGRKRAIFKPNLTDEGENVSNELAITRRFLDVITSTYTF